MTNGSMSVTVSPSDAVYKGQVVTIQTTITVSGTNTTPTGITFRMLDPSGNSTSYSSSQLTNSTSGVYSVDVIGDEEGIFYYNFTSTGTAQAAYTGQFTVINTVFDT